MGSGNDSLRDSRGKKTLSVNLEIKRQLLIK